MQVPIKNLVYQDMLEKIDKDTTYPQVQSMVRYLVQHEMVSNREAALLMQMITAVFASQTIEDDERVHILKSLILTLQNFA